MTTKFTPTIASLTRDLDNAEQAAADRLAHCKRLTTEKAELIEAMQATINGYSELMQRAVKDAEKYQPEGNEPIWAYIEDASDYISKARALLARLS